MAADETSTARFLADLRKIVGSSHVLTGGAATPFATGYRFGGGPVAGVIQPRTLVEMWRVAQACVAADRIVIVQAANTGLTGGSTPDGSYDREVVIISTRRITGIFPIRDGEQVVCLSGATLNDLERVLSPLGREPHSVIGSSCIGASVVGGICNSSGGTLVRRGPAYTEYALFAQADADGRLQLHNHLGIRLGNDPETILRNLDEGRFADMDLEPEVRAASAAADYDAIVRDIDAPTPARFNADSARLFDASGSAGRILVFAVRLDTFPRAAGGAVFYLGTNDPDELTRVRRRILAEAPSLPVSGEYIHRQAFDLADAYGKDMMVAIRTLGTRRLPWLFGAKAWVDRVARRLPILPAALSDRLMQTAGRFLPDQLPARLRSWRDRFEHHLVLKVDDGGADFTRAMLAELFPSESGAVFECSPKEADRAMLHRFAVAGAAVRYRAVNSHEVEEIVALDVALPRNDRIWFERLPDDVEACLVAKLYYGHFFCHVFHQDYLVRKGVDAVALEHRLLALMDVRGAEYPAEHNVGHLYPAKPALAAHYRRLDPANIFNPGIGKTSRARNWQ